MGSWIDSVQLDDMQREAVTTTDGPLLVVAGPGSGKTRVLTHRVAYLVTDADVPAHRIAALTFTNRAAAEMRARVEALTTTDVAKTVTVATFHSLCARILRRFHEAAGLGRQFTIVDSKESKALLTASAKRLGLLTGLAPNEQKEFVASAIRLMSTARNAGVLAAHLWTPPPGFGDVGVLWADYETTLRETDSVDFDGLLTHVRQLGNNPETVEVIARRFSHLLVDEYQDTNHIQHQIVDMLIGRNDNVCAVGDPDQSIYAFRGAAGSVADVFTHRWPDAHVVVLHRNYRSAPEICQTSTAIISANPATYRAAGTPVSDHPSTRVQVVAAGSPDDEASWVGTQVASLCTADPGTSIAVLVRANHQTRSLEKAFTTARLAHVVLGTTRFADRAEVKDVMSWLRLVVNPRDVSAVQRAVGVPKRSIGDVTTKQLVDHMLAHPTTSIVQACSQLGDQLRNRVAVAAFGEAVTRVTEVAAVEGLVPVLMFVLDSLQVRAAAIGTDEKAPERNDNLNELVAYAHTVALQQAGASGVEQVLAFTEALTLAGSDETPGDGGQVPVAISTIHAAKGKEYDHVFVVGCEEDVIPHVRSSTVDEIAEERRLMFVACSRARASLTLSVCARRMLNGTYVSNSPSRFLSDIPQEIVHRILLDDTPKDVRAQRRRGSSSQYRRRFATSAPSTSRTSAFAEPSREPQVKRMWKADTSAVATTPAPSSWVVEGRVQHASLGAGTVVAVDDRMVSVAFTDGVTRQFLTTTHVLTACP